MQWWLWLIFVPLGLSARQFNVNTTDSDLEEALDSCAVSGLQGPTSCVCMSADTPANDSLNGRWRVDNYTCYTCNKQARKAATCHGPGHGTGCNGISKYWRRGCRPKCLCRCPERPSVYVDCIEWCRRGNASCRNETDENGNNRVKNKHEDDQLHPDVAIKVVGGICGVLIVAVFLLAFGSYQYRHVSHSFANPSVNQDSDAVESPSINPGPPPIALQVMGPRAESTIDEEPGSSSSGLKVSDVQVRVPVDYVPVDEEPVDYVPVDEEPVDYVPVDEEPVDEEPVDEPVYQVKVDNVPVNVRRIEVQPCQRNEDEGSDS